jgi:hypothetical protein
VNGAGCHDVSAVTTDIDSVLTAADHRLLAVILVKQLAALKHAASQKGRELTTGHPEHWGRCFRLTTITGRACSRLERHAQVVFSAISPT